MADQRQVVLKGEVQRFLTVNDRLKKEHGREWDELTRLFRETREVYPPHLKWKWNSDTPTTLESWVELTNAGKSPRPNGEDMSELEQLYNVSPDGEETRFYRRWRRLMAYTDDILHVSSAPGVESGVSGVLLGPAPVEGGHGQSAAPLQASSGSSSADGQRVSSAASVSSAPQAPSRSTVELPAVQPPLNPENHQRTFDNLRGVASAILAQRDALNVQLTALQRWIEQFWRDSEELGSATRLVADTNWVTREDYATLRQQYDALHRQNRILREDNQALQQEAHHIANEREEARLWTANLLVKQARGLWKLFNMRSESDKRLSERDRSLTEQVYNDLLKALDSACGVKALTVREGDPFDDKRMEDVAAPVKAREKQLRGCVAWVEEPGFYDQTGTWKAKVAVYSGE